MAKEKKEKEKKNLAKTLSDLQKQYGAMNIGTVGELNKVMVKVPAIPTGSLKLDSAIQCGGFPRGRIIEIYGPEASGKSLISLHGIAECQKRGGTAAFIDAEHAFNPTFAESLGVELESLVFNQPDYGEQGLSIVEALVDSGEVDMIVIDSVANLTPKAEYEGEMEQNHVGLQARMMSQALRKLTAKASNTNTTIIFINQVRNKIGVLYGNPEDTPGGKSLKFYASLRLEAKKIDLIKSGENTIGHRMRVKVIKNKVGMPFRTAEFDVLWNGGGIDKVGEMIDVAFDAGVIERSGAWYTYGESRYHGKDQMRSAILSDDALLNSVRSDVMKLLKLDEIKDAVEEEVEEE